jgi:hypothetical protein
MVVGLLSLPGRFARLDCDFFLWLVTCGTAPSCCLFVAVVSAATAGAGGRIEMRRTGRGCEYPRVTVAAAAADEAPEDG